MLDSFIHAPMVHYVICVCLSWKLPSFAACRPDTNGSQFFVTLAPTPHLNGRHTVFGKVTSGIETVRAIGVTDTDGQDRPTNPVTMEKVTVFRD